MPDPIAKKIALLCGNGDLPRLLAEQLLTAGLDFTCIGFEGMTSPDTIKDIALFKIGHVGSILDYLQKEKVTHIVMVGALKRPSLTSLSLDTKGAKWLAQIGVSAFRGDDSLLKTIIQLIEKEGLHVLSPQEIVPSLLTPSGLLTKAHPCTQALSDIEHGKNILSALSSLDVGQATVIQQGLVLGIEAIEGTADLLGRIIPYKRDGFGGVLVKLAKTQQTHRVDLPTIGLKTVEQLKKAGLSGICLSAKTSQIIDYDAVIRAMNEANLFLMAIE